MRPGDVLGVCVSIAHVRGIHALPRYLSARGGYEHAPSVCLLLSREDGVADDQLPGRIGVLTKRPVSLRRREARLRPALLEDLLRAVSRDRVVLSHHALRWS